MPESSERPYPPLPLANRVLSLESADDPVTAYELLGAGTKAALVALLPSDWSFEGKRVLDFGCGAGRTLRHFLSEAEVAEVWGVDIDGPSVEWIERELSPPLRASRCGVDPPLDFDDASVDLTWAVSVFTHLSDNSLSWLRELHRVLKPGGLLIATYTGEWSSEILAGEEWDEDHVGMNVLCPNNGWETGGPMTLMSEWWVSAHWGRAFEIVERVPETHSQSWVLMKKRDVEVTVADLQEPADDPREVSALRHNLDQAERLHQAALAHQQDQTQQVRSEYERSLSWRLTRPLRTVRRLSRGTPADNNR